MGGGRRLTSSYRSGLQVEVENNSKDFVVEDGMGMAEVATGPRAQRCGWPSPAPVQLPRRPRMSGMPDV